MIRRTTIAVVISIFFSSLVAPVEGYQQTAGPGLNVSATRFTGTLDSGKDRGAAIAGAASLIVSGASEDDTMTGRIQIQLDEASWQLIGHQSGVAQESIGPSILPVTLGFRKGDSCPDLRIETENLQFNSGSQSIRIGKLTFHLRETQNPVIRLLCAWARQINVDRQRNGIVKAINRALSEPVNS